MTISPISPDLKPLPPRTLADVRDQVAQEIAARMVNKAELLDGVKISVMMTFSKRDDVGFLQQIAKAIKDSSIPDFLFVVATTGPPVSSNPALYTSLVIGSTLLTSAKFIGRVHGVQNEPTFYCIISVKEIGYTSGYDEAALWDVVRKSALRPIDPLVPPPGSQGVDKLLLEVRAKLQRLKPTEAHEELREPEVGAPTFLVDIRPAAQRDQEGGITGSLVIERNVLEWKFDPRSASRLNIADRYDLRIIVFCQDGDASSLAAYSLQRLGLLNATDMIGGYRAWRDARLPIDIPIRTARSALSLS
ncbi:hypothetical protein GYMLUDRAFT_76888 [Collybiopsis luxurians FD-317 M1]|uniref:Unplaced genomic scaffold GYMLUscaffold_65, whole genome shotgun sequence n=1 Tax=Collybiopsis luxurians FD-317 M1 TaxID=944289 RepID=A0A0D0BY11_9AGAR|nr:hypothetical protein GYMLUDRAFT_76888 [Collybiopsis luxurians FD-317 M1]